MVNTFIYIKLLLKFFFGIEKDKNSEYDLKSKNFNPVKLTVLITVIIVFVYAGILTYKFSILTNIINKQCPELTTKKIN